MVSFQIRITPSNWSEIQNFLAEVQENKHLDVEYIYHRLRYHNAFQFVATDTEMNMLRSCGASIGGIHGTDPEREKQAAIESDHVIQQKSIISEILKPDTIGVSMLEQGLFSFWLILFQLSKNRSCRLL